MGGAEIGKRWEVDGAEWIDSDDEDAPCERNLSGRDFVGGILTVPRDGEPFVARGEAVLELLDEDSGRDLSRDAEDTVRSRCSGGGGLGMVESVMKVSNSRDEMTCSRLRWDRFDTELEMRAVVVNIEASSSEVALDDDLPRLEDKLGLPPAGSPGRELGARFGRTVVSASGEPESTSSDLLLRKVAADAEDTRRARFRASVISKSSAVAACKVSRRV